MTDSTGLLSDAVSSDATETQLAQAGDSIVVTRPDIGTSIQIAAPGDSVQLDFDPETVAKAEIRDGNLEITFDNGSVAVIQGYEAWAAAGGQPTGPEGGIVDIAQLGQAGADQAAADAPPVCAMPDANVVDVPVPAAGERITLAVQPGDVIRLACSFRDVAAVEAGDSLEMTFPGGGVVVVENFSAWVAAQGATITDCVCGGLNLAEFIVAIGLNPEDVLPAAGDGAPGGPQGNDLTGSGFTPDPGPQLLAGLPYPHILPPTSLGYGVPGPDRGIFPDDEDQGDRDLGGPLASAPDPLVVNESTRPLQLQVQALSFQLTGFDALADGEACAPPTGPVEFAPDEDSGQIFVNDDFGPDGQGEPPLVSFEYTGTTPVDDVNGVLQPDGVTLRITSTDPTRPWHIDVDINTGLATVHLTGTYDHNGPNSDGNIALETFNYTIQDEDGDTSSTQVTVQIVDSVPVAHDDCEVCIVEPGNGTEIVEPVGGNVMANDDLGADQFLPDGTDLISFTYDNGTQMALVPEGGSTTVTTAIGGELTVHSNGDWSYVPPATVDNSDGDVHDNFTYTIRDGDGDTSPAVQPICIQDGAAPIAYDNEQCVNEGATQNVMIVADVSGSMDDDDIDPDTAGKQTRLDLEKESLTALVDKYAALDGTVTITLIAFASGEDPNLPGGTDKDGARNLGTFTFSSTTDQGYLDAIAAIDSLAIGMDGLQTETEYDDALILAQDVLAGQLVTQADGTTNTVYFLSDGDPNPDSNGADATDWQDFVNSKDIEVVAVGIGKGVSAAELNKVEDGGDASVIVDDQGDLAGLLTNTAGNASVSGNVLIDPTEEPNISPADDPVGSVDDFGSDGAGAPKIVSLQHDGHTYDLTDVVGGEGGNVISNDGHTITILTELGGILSFNFGTGDYTYTAPDTVDHSKDAEVDERFTYTIQDADGDTDPADLVICIKDNVEPPDVTLAIGAEGKGGCVEEDSKLGDLDNQVAVHAEAQADDSLTQLVITGFTNEPGWSFDLDGLKGAGVDVGASEFDTSDGKITLVFNAGVQVFDGTFFVQPPADSDVDLGTITATATAAAAGDPGQTLSSSTNLDVTVDANADPVTVSLDVNDSGDDNASFQAGESGTVAVTATFGDTGDGSEDHTVVVEIPDGFVVGALTGLPAGVAASVNGEGNVAFTVANDVPQFTYAIPVTNIGAGEGGHDFKATVRAEETNTDDTECDPSVADNVAEAEAIDTAVVRIIERPTVGILVGTDGTCLEEDSQTTDAGNTVHLDAAAFPGDVLTQLVVEGFDPATVVGTGGQQATWIIDLDALNAHPDVADVDYDTATGTLTITFEAGVASFTGTFGLAPPANTDVDLGELTVTATSADAVDPTLTSTESDSATVTVDANADPVTVTLNVNDSGDAGGTFQQNETGTVQVIASFGDVQDGSEIHTVLVDVPAGFTPGALVNLPAGVTAQVVDGNNVLFTVAQGTAGFDYTFNVTNTGGGTGPSNFTATAKADENPATDIECDPGEPDNVSTAVDTENENRQDDTPVIDPAPVTVDDDDTPGFNGGATDTADPPNASATASLNASFGVDAPGDVVFGANANPAVLSNGDAITYTVSGDGKTLTATADAGGPEQRTVFTVVINNDGTYTYTLLDALDHPLGGGENNLGLAFNVTATDNNGDSTGGVINVTVNDDSPISTGGQAGTVEEDNLPGGIDENAGFNLTASGSIGINFGADAPGDVSTITGPAGLTSGGVGVTYSFDAATNTLTGSAGGDTVFTLSINPQTGQYNFTLAGPLDHPAGGPGGDEQALNLDFGFTATDFDGDPVNGNFTVAVRDDVPNANADSNAAEAQTINLVIIFDRSGSMDENPNVPGFTTRIDLARAAVASMLAAYESVANVNVLVVDFSSSAANSGWLSSGADANNYLAGLDADGNTNYNAAIQEAMGSYNSGLPGADQTLVYFLSDGKPNPENSSLQASGTIDEWETFLTTNGVDESIAVGIGEGVDDVDGDLSDVAFPNDDAGNVIIVTDEIEVFDALVATVNAKASGNVLTDPPADQFGADGPDAVRIVSIVVNVQGVGLTTFTFNGAQISNNQSLPVQLGSTLAVVTSLGGELTFDFSNGDYDYAAPNTGGQDQFTYTIADDDGDTDSATLTINLDDLLVEQPDRVFGTNGNDTGAGALAGGSETDIMSGGDGNDDIFGGDGDDHISGGSGADTIQGGDGDDVIVGGNQGEETDSPNDPRPGGDDLGDLLLGGAGDDFIVGNEGQDTIIGGAGNDTIDLTGPGPDVVLYNSELDGHDVIVNFDADQSNGTTDQLNLDGLFDSLNIATENRASRVDIDDNGLVVEIRVDTDGDANFDLHVATVNTAVDSGVAVGTEIIVGAQ